VLCSENLFTGEYSRDYLSDNSLVIRIYFSSLQYVEMISSPTYSLMGLFSDVGGAMGLMLGATLLTVYEITEFSAILGFHYIAEKLKRRGNTNDSQQTATADA